MSDLTLLDRIYLWNARYLERPSLALIPWQRPLGALFEITARIGGRLPDGMTVTQDAQGGLLLTPKGVRPDAPRLLYFHGGGFTIGSPRTHRALVGHVAHAAGMIAHAPRYPLAPEHPFPAAPEACFEIYRQMCEHGQAPSAMAGDSAGGNLALVTSMAARDAGLPLPKALGLIAPVLDMTGDIEERFAAAPSEHLIPAAWARRIKTAYLRGQDPADPRASPLLGDLSGLPPVLLQVAKGEALADDARRLAEMLPKSQVETWDGLQHVWHLRAGTGAAATRACQSLGTFLKQSMG